MSSGDQQLQQLQRELTKRAIAYMTLRDLLVTIHRDHPELSLGPALLAADGLASEKALAEHDERIVAVVRAERDEAVAALDAQRDALTSAIKSENEARAQVAALREALSQLLGQGHNLKAFAGTMLRWNEPGVDFSDEARRIVEHANEWHRLICAALASTEQAAREHKAAPLLDADDSPACNNGGTP